MSLSGGSGSDAGRFSRLDDGDAVELAQTIEAGLAASHLAGSMVPGGFGSPAELQEIGRQGDEAFQAMVGGWMWLVESIAGNHLDRGLEFADLVQEGGLSLVHAVQTFDPAQGAGFTAHAGWWIRRGMPRALADQGRAIRLPLYFTRQVDQLTRTSERLEGELNLAPNDAQLAAAMRLDIAHVQKLKRHLSRPLSTDAPLPGRSGPGGATIAETFYDPEDHSMDDIIEHTALRGLLHTALDSLSRREADVLALRFGLADGTARTLEEIGQLYGLTRERIRQIESQSLAKLRRHSHSRSLRDFFGAAKVHPDCLPAAESAAS